MADPPTVRMTYAELATARRISVGSARRMTVRRRWPKQIGNDGLTRVDVPASALTVAPTDAREDAGGDAPTDAPPGAGTTTQAPLDAEAMIAAIVAGVAAATDARTDAMLAELQLQLARERERADRAEAALEAQAAEHRRIVAALTERIPKPWWRWRRR